MPKQPEKKEVLKKPSQRFVYDETDVNHLFRLGDIGTVFSKKDENDMAIETILKKIKISKKKTKK